MNQKADERFLPREFKIPFDPFMRHFERYFQSVKLLNKTGKGETWLDCACGSGYGTNLLSNFSDSVIGYDIDVGAVNFAKENYKNNYCDFTHNIQEYEKHFDVVFSIETIEHMIREHAVEFLTTLRKSLKDEGNLIITTPIVPKTNFNPINEYHFIEYSDYDFRTLLSSVGFFVIDTVFIKTTFTDGETKDQGHYKCEKINE